MSKTEHSWRNNLAGEPIINPVLNRSNEQEKSTHSVKSDLGVPPAHKELSKSPKSYSMANVNIAPIDPKHGRDFQHTKSFEAKKEEKKAEEEKSKKSTKKGSYVGKTGEVYGFLKKEYQLRRGIAFNVGGGILVITKSNENEKEKEKKIQAEIETRGKVLVDFWEQFFLKSKAASFKPNASSSKLSDTKKSEESLSLIHI
eukprot:TRINITY_DN16245_c0_g1_i1.p2 TRINITY_DN16245_c0_g1~~TRINITY_DN16245_c0_g1_i1.p2  ORF type:complete len:200 (+),score=51.99 TRINITY_DN16245_c0_g1_i1:66-665(+)